jgi:biopolymer transport protein ExbD
MKLSRIKKSRKGRIEIIPMIDVMFFLLATFILASLSMQKINSLPINLPSGKADKIDIHQQITLTINKNNQIFVDKKAADLNSLSQTIHTLLDQGGSTTVIIAADKNAAHGTVAESMIKAKEAGAEHFSIIVQNQ